MVESRSLVFSGVGQVELVSDSVGELQDGEVLIEISHSGVSPGTELRCLAGDQPDSLDFPFVPGYSQVGRVVDGEADWIGKRVFCSGTQGSRFGIQWGGHCSMSRCRVDSVIVVPDGVRDEDAALLHMAGIAYRGLTRARLVSCKTVLVVGLGLIGQLSASMYLAAGYEVYAVDLEEARVELARARGVTAAVASGGISETAREWQPGGFDLVADATGSVRVLAESISLLKDRGWGDVEEEPGVLVLQGSYPGDVVFDYQRAFVKEMTLVMPRATMPMDKRAVLGWMLEGKVDSEGLARVVPVEEALGAYGALGDRSFERLTAVFEW